MRSGKVILGLLASTATGALLGILFTPEKGSDIRKKISEKSVDYADTVKGKFSGVVRNISDKYEGAKKDITGFVKRGKC